MFPEIQKIIDICRFEEDPNWVMMRNFFSNVDYENYYDILRNMNAGIHVNINAMDFIGGAYVLNNPEKPVTKDRPEKEDINEYIDVKDDSIVIKEPCVIYGGTELPRGVFVGEKSYFEKGVSLTDTVINAPTYFAENAKVEHTRFPASSTARANYVGENAVVSEVDSVRGCFISGGPLKEEGRKQTYIHADSINNMIIGAYAGMADGTDTFNHPLPGEEFAIIDPETQEKHEFPLITHFKKLPTFIGLEAVVGPQCLINGGSIIGADVIIPRKTNIDGMVTGKGRYIQIDNVNREINQD